MDFDPVLSWPNSPAPITSTSSSSIPYDHHHIDPTLSLSSQQPYHDNITFTIDGTTLSSHTTQPSLLHHQTSHPHPTQTYIHDHSTTHTQAHHETPVPTTPSTHSTHSSYSSHSSHDPITPHSHSSHSSPTHHSTTTTTPHPTSPTHHSSPNLIHVPPPPQDPPRVRNKNIPSSDPLLQQAFSQKVAAKQVKRPRRATKLVVGEKVVPVSRRTKYVKLLETMNMELAAVRQQLTHTQERLQRYEPDWSASHAFKNTSVKAMIPSTEEPSNKKRKLSDENTSTSTTPSSTSTALTIINSSSTSLSSSSSSSSSSNELVSFDNLLPQTRQFITMSLAAQSLHDATYVRSPILFAKMDLRRRVLDANLAFCETHGWELSELIGRQLPPGNPARMFRRSPALKQLVSKLAATNVSELTMHEVNDGVAPLKKGLPVGLTAVDLLPTPDMLTAMTQLYAHRAPYANFRSRHVNGKGQLVDARVTAWVVYEDGPSHPQHSSSVLQAAVDSQVVPIHSDNPSNAEAAAALDDLQSLLATFHENFTHSANPFFDKLKNHLDPKLFRCFHHPTLDVNSAIQQTFGGPKPLYLMTMVSPGDQQILRHPPTTHPHEQIDQFQREMHARWNLNANVGSLPIAF